MIKKSFALDFQWATQEPFLFCVHHLDHYPVGNKEFAVPESLLKGRDMGQDFQLKDGFRMYHGESVPGFPVHPHRGFETITIVRQGFVDHADSLGAAGRYGAGDVQWMTAGAGVQHSEMFPLLHQDKENPVEIFQIWLNLPRKNKMAEAHFKMFWREDIPKLSLDSGRAEVTLIAGVWGESRGLPPPPQSWASEANGDLGVFLIRISPGGAIELPMTSNGVERSLYFFSGDELSLNGQALPPKSGHQMGGASSAKISVPATSKQSVELLVLQAKPIGESLAQHGPFVMNTRDEIMQAFQDYQRTQFGGWPWPRHDMVHGPNLERFAKLPDGTVLRPKTL